MTDIMNSNFTELTYDDMLETIGGWDWDAFADFVGGVTVVSAAIPGAGAVTIIGGCFYAGYKLGRAIKG